MKVLVIGAGMGGLTAAIALRAHGHEVAVYERVRQNRPVGAAISIWSNGVKCLNYLGLGDKVKALGGSMDNMAYMDGFTGETMCRFSLDPLVDEVGQKPYPVSRAELQAMLFDEVGAENIHLGHNLVRVEDDGTTVTAHFEDGTTATGDVLIGADGAHSTVRQYVLGGPVDRRYSGYVNYNGLVPVTDDLGPADQWTTWVGEGKRASLMPIADDRFYFFLDVPLPLGLSADKDSYKADLTEYFTDWAAPVQNLIGALDPATTNRVEIHDIEPFMTWTRGRVALLGDAGHSTTPDIGQGGCQAFEDAIVLAMALQTNTLGVEDALVRYQNRRNERTAEMVLRARKRAEVTHGMDMAVTEAWYDELRTEDGTNIIRGIVSNIVGNPVS